MKANESRESPSRRYAAIYRLVRAIPEGRVATYGQVAALAGLPGRARLVGHALRILPDAFQVPWHRVVNAQGGISRRGSQDPGSERTQYLRLAAEGIRFNRNGRIPLSSFQWRRPGAGPTAGWPRRRPAGGGRRKRRAPHAGSGDVLPESRSPISGAPRRNPPR